jgi:hypothetical protein
MPETTGEHNLEGRRMPPDEDPRALLRCHPKYLVIGPHNRTYAETAHVDETKRWAELCEELAEFAPYQWHPEKEVGAAGVMMALTHVMARFSGNGELRQAWVLAYLGGAWMKAPFGKRQP